MKYLLCYVAFMPFFIALMFLLVCLEERVHLFFEIEELDSPGLLKSLVFIFLETLADVLILVILMALGGLIWHLLSLLII